MKRRGEEEEEEETDEEDDGLTPTLRMLIRNKVPLLLSGYDPRRTLDVRPPKVAKSKE